MTILFQLLTGSVLRRYIDVKINTGKEFETRIVERPGRWMPADELKTLSSQLASVASHTLPAGSLKYGVFSGNPDNLKNTVITLVRRKDNGQPIAFNALAIMDLELGRQPLQVLHLGLVMVDPNERSQGLSWVLYGLTCILLFFRNQFRPFWVSNVTPGAGHRRHGGRDVFERLSCPGGGQEPHTQAPSRRQANHAEPPKRFRRRR